MKKKIYQILLVIKDSFAGFNEDNAFKLSASLSYYTLFSIAPMILLFLSIVGTIYGKDALSGQLYGQIDGLMGSEAALQVQQMVKSAELSGKTGLAKIVSIIMLFVGATGVFAEIQDSINHIWSLKAKPKNGFIKYILNRFLSFSLIMSFGFIFIVSLLFNTVIDLVSHKFFGIFTESAYYIFYAINIIFIWIVMTVLFTIIFSVLPDGKVSIRDSSVGAGVTALLFLVGKYIIGIYLGSSNATSIYGAASSVVILLLWVYYSSAILYFGAEFTKAFALHLGKGIHPASYTVLIKQTEVNAPDRVIKNLPKNTEI